MPGTKQPKGFVFLFFVVLLCQYERSFCVKDFFVMFFLPLPFTILTRSCDLLLQVCNLSPFAYKNMICTFYVTVIHMLSRFRSIVTSSAVFGQCTFMMYTCILFSARSITDTMVPCKLNLSVPVHATNITYFIYICILNNSIISIILCNVVRKTMYLEILKFIKHTYNRLVYQYLTILSRLLNMVLIGCIAILLLRMLNITMTKWLYIMIFMSVMDSFYMSMYVISAFIWRKGGHPMTLSYHKYIVHQICCSSYVFSENINNQLLSNIYHTLCNMSIRLQLYHVFENYFFDAIIIKPGITVKCETLHQEFEFVNVLCINTQCYNPFLVILKKSRYSFNEHCTLLFICTHDIIRLIYINVHSFMHIIVIWVHNAYINDIQWRTM